MHRCLVTAGCCHYGLLCCLYLAFFTTRGYFLQSCFLVMKRASAGSLKPPSFNSSAFRCPMAFSFLLTFLLFFLAQLLRAAATPEGAICSEVTTERGLLGVSWSKPNLSLRMRH